MYKLIYTETGEEVFDKYELPIRFEKKEDAEKAAKELSISIANERPHEFIEGGLHLGRRTQIIDVKEIFEEEEENNTEEAALGMFLLGAAAGSLTTLRLKRLMQTKGMPKKLKRENGNYYAYDGTRDKFYAITPAEFKELYGSDNYSEAPDQKGHETIYTLKLLAKGGPVTDAKTQEQIKKLEAAIKSPTTPADMRKQMQAKLKQLKAKSAPAPVKDKKEELKQALSELDLSAAEIEKCQAIINEHRRQQREANPSPKKTRITLFKEKMKGVTGYLARQVKDDEEAQNKIKKLTEAYITKVGLVIFGSDAKGLNPKQVQKLVEEKF